MRKGRVENIVPKIDALYVHSCKLRKCCIVNRCLCYSLDTSIIISVVSSIEMCWNLRQLFDTLDNYFVPITCFVNHLASYLGNTKPTPTNIQINYITSTQCMNSEAKSLLGGSRDVHGKIIIDSRDHTTHKLQKDKQIHFNTRPLFTLGTLQILHYSLHNCSMLTWMN